MEGDIWLRGASWRAVFGLEVRLGGRYLAERCVLEGGIWLRGSFWRSVFDLEARLGGWWLA